MNYFATECGLTKHTKELWAKKPEQIVYPLQDVDPKTYTKPKFKKKRIKISQAEIESFQEKRIFSAIRRMQ